MQIRGDPPLLVWYMRGEIDDISSPVPACFLVILLLLAFFGLEQRVLPLLHVNA